MADVHQQKPTDWPLYHEGPSSATGNVGTATAPLEVQGQRSNSRDQDWDNFMRSLEQQGQEASPSDNMDLLFGLESLSAQIGAANDMSDFDPSSATTSNSSLSSSLSDPNSATHPFITWPTMPLSQQAPHMEYQQHMIQHGNWMPQHHFHPAHNFTMHGTEDVGIQMMPTSHPIEQHQKMQFHELYPDQRSPSHPQHGFNQDMSNGWEQLERSIPPREDLFRDDDDRESADPADPCYAQLLYQCLKEAPGYTLSLRELYDWVSQHSQKAKDPKNRGWQNSVRHNLSMNAAFARVPYGQYAGPKKGSLWRLTDEALRDGVISTTRYRKDPKRKPERRAFPALNRQASGAKGGRATRDATRLRQQQQQQRAHGLPIPRGGHGFRRHRHGPQYSPYSAHSRSLEASPQPGFNPLPPTPQGASPYFIDEPCRYPPLPMSAPQTPPPGTSMKELQEVNFDNGPKHYNNFEFLPLDPYNGGPNGLFGNQDPEMPQNDPDTPTPSLMTEASFMTDDNLPSAVMAHVQTQRDDTTGF